VVVLP